MLRFESLYDAESPSWTSFYVPVLDRKKNKTFVGDPTEYNPGSAKKIARLRKKPVGILKESFCKAAGVAGRRTRVLNFVDVSARKLLKKGGDAGHAHMQNIVLTMSFASVK